MLVACARCPTRIRVDDLYIYHELERLGWKETNEGWICPHCVNEKMKALNAAVAAMEDIHER